MAAADLDTVVFDLGGVLLEWAPQLPYEQVMPAAEVPAFMAAIDFWAWNRRHDAGQPYAVGEQGLIKRFPGSAEAVLAYRKHFDRSLTSMVPGTAAVLAELQQAGIRLLALTNWSAETFPRAERRFGVLDRFEAIVVSGRELLVKPDPAIFELLCSRHRVDPARSAFVDDSPANVAAAERLGMTALEFRGAAALRTDLTTLGLLGPRALVAEPLFHLAEAGLWAAAERRGAYDWSTRGVTFEARGYVHCSFQRQLPAVRRLVYGDLADADLTLLQIDPTGLEVIVEDLGAGEPYPHLYEPLPVSAVRSARPL